MDRPTSIFNIAAQAVKDTVNGFQINDIWGKGHAFLTTGLALRGACILAGAGISSAVLPTAVILGICLASAWYDGKRRRETGHAPRYWP